MKISPWLKFTRREQIYGIKASVTFAAIRRFFRRLFRRNEEEPPEPEHSKTPNIGETSNQQDKDSIQDDRD